MEIKWYSGYKGDERPLSIIVNGEEQMVKKVIREELVENELTCHREHIFVVQTDKGIYKVSKTFTRS